jgi:hypothetical protein
MFPVLLLFIYVPTVSFCEVESSRTLVNPITAQGPIILG